jgi:ribose-phosphate pyrophosphokinase
MSGYSGFNMWKEHITTESLFAETITKTLSLKNLCILCPDVGALKRAKNLVSCINKLSKVELETAIINKERLKPNEVAGLTLIGDVKGKDCVIVDDMVDTGGTMFKAVKLLKEKGAKDVVIFATHGLFSSGFYENLEKSEVDQFYVTNSLRCREKKREEMSVVRRLDLSGMLVGFVKSRFGL